jgi:hypothetical protein
MRLLWLSILARRSVAGVSPLCSWTAAPNSHTPTGANSPFDSLNETVSR